ncbi:MAG TPA: DNA repair protein RadC [Steroidobacteraceae bacterium]|nr:DNA repair protein RadC [Steroidobacteraceae bacterium]
MRLQQWPAGERPREKLIAAGARALTESELLAIWLRCGRRGANAVELARELLEAFGSLRGVLTADAERLCRHSGIGLARYAELQAALELARRHHLASLKAGPALTSPRLAGDYLVAELRDRDYEVFGCLYLDSRHRLTGFEELFTGTIDGASVHPREVVKRALARRAAAVILVHNHPLCCTAVVTPAHPVTRPRPGRGWRRGHGHPAGVPPRVVRSAGEAAGV